VFQLRRDGYGKGAEEDVSQAGFAALCAAAIAAVIALVRAPFVVLAALR
jgi:hypothetical protein